MQLTKILEDSVTSLGYTCKLQATNVSQFLANIRIITRVTFKINLKWRLLGQILKEIGLLFIPTFGHTASR